MDEASKKRSLTLATGAAFECLIRKRKEKGEVTFSS
jgi:hypothetical protein